MAERTLPHVAVRRMVCNHSRRVAGARPQIIVLHSTEGTNLVGLADLQGLGAFFDDAKNEVSSHVATDAEGNSARFVADEDKAWHCAKYNSAALGIEQVGRAAQTEWDAEQQAETARWLAFWSRLHGIPLHKGAVSGGVVTKPGVIRHSELGSLGGGHADPGSHYPMERVMDLARRFREHQPA
jgi:N-acetyl-anhydromuramyl-L-alanine amidase AmpD